MNRRDVFGRSADCEVFDMATINKVRKQIERVSALQGWRMRWYMQ